MIKGQPEQDWRIVDQSLTQLCDTNSFPFTCQIGGLSIRLAVNPSWVDLIRKHSFDSGSIFVQPTYESLLKALEVLTHSQILDQIRSDHKHPESQILNLKP